MQILRVGIKGEMRGPGRDGGSNTFRALGPRGKGSPRAAGGALAAGRSRNATLESRFHAV